MTRTMRMTLTVGFAVGALVAMLGHRLHAQGTDPNAAPNPYKMQDKWVQLPAGRTMGQAIKVQVDHSDGKSIWVFDRCGSKECTGSMVAPGWTTPATSTPAG